MVAYVVTISVQELMDRINKERADAYTSGYVQGRKEAAKEAASREPEFTELIKGVKELKRYLEYKGYWKGSVNTLNKVAFQLLAEGDRHGHGLLFRRTYIDHTFANGFRFTPPPKK